MAVGVSVGRRTGRWAAVRVGDGVAVLVMVAVGVLVGVGVRVNVGVSVGVNVGRAVAVAVGVWVGVGVKVNVGVGVGSNATTRPAQTPSPVAAYRMLRSSGSRTRAVISIVPGARRSCQSGPPRSLR